MNTLFLLMVEFNSATIELKKISDKYLGLSEKEACRKANAQTLPFPVFRTSQKSGWLLKTEDLAKWIDAKRDEAANDWQKARV